MFSNKENVNILTSLLLAHGIRHAVVCPGSRNAPIVHNLSVCGGMRCVPVTDERSAGFVAIGIAQATGKPVVVCVTSGSALLNLAPAAAEACYQHLPLVVVSADRPQAWIGQLDGQTMPQADALGRFVRRAVSLPEPADGTSRWMCRRLVNEALSLATWREPAPVHINVPISEPLFGFGEVALPAVGAFGVLPAYGGSPRQAALESAFSAASRPMVVLGQLPPGFVGGEVVAALGREAVVLHEPLSVGAVRFEEVLRSAGDASGYAPDLVVYVGGTIVGKRLRKLLRKCGAPTYYITPDASELHDPTTWLSAVVDCGCAEGVRSLLASLAAHGGASSPQVAEGRRLFRQRWASALASADAHAAEFEPPFSQMAAVRYLEEQLEDMPADCHVHYANSSAVRLANIYAAHYVWCNRGLNGIEGSLSAAAGFSVATDSMVVCVIGDLSFFYDQNALWNASLRGNLRILLLNNHCGGIFHSLPGLEGSPSRDSLVAASHAASAQGICAQNDVGYLRAYDMREMRLGIVALLTRQASRPMLLEVFTDAEADAEAVREYYGGLGTLS